MPLSHRRKGRARSAAKCAGYAWGREGRRSVILPRPFRNQHAPFAQAKGARTKRSEVRGVCAGTGWAKKRHTPTPLSQPTRPFRTGERGAHEAQRSARGMRGDGRGRRGCPANTAVPELSRRRYTRIRHPAAHSCCHVREVRIQYLIHNAISVQL